MGADLYNERFKKQSPEFQKREKEFDDYKNSIPNDRKMTDEERKKYFELYDRAYEDPYYFRESYGGGGLLSALDLSWWRDVGKIIDECPGNKPPEGLTEEEVDAFYDARDINVDAEGCQKFIDLLESRKHMLDAPDYDFVEKGKDWLTGEEYETHVGNWYRERYDRLIKFLTIAKEHGGFYASI